VALRRQAEVRTDVTRAPEAVGPVDGGAEGERRQRADAGHAHQPAADRLGPCDVEHAPGERRKLAGHGRDDREQRLGRGR
jgi:hypothetical protein